MDTDRGIFGITQDVLSVHAISSDIEMYKHRFTVQEIIKITCNIIITALHCSWKIINKVGMGFLEYS